MEENTQTMKAKARAHGERDSLRISHEKIHGFYFRVIPSRPLPNPTTRRRHSLLQTRPRKAASNGHREPGTSPPSGLTSPGDGTR